MGNFGPYILMYHYTAYHMYFVSPAKHFYRTKTHACDEGWNIPIVLLE